MKIIRHTLDSFEGKNINDDKISNSISKVINNLNIKKNAIEHFITHVQDYLVEQGTLKSKQPNSSNEVKDANAINDIKNDMHAEPAQTLTNAHVNIDNSVTAHVNIDNSVTAHVNIDNSVTAHEVLNTNTEASTHAVDTIITDTAVESAGIKNDLYNKFSKYMSMLKLTQHKIPIAILSTVLGIGTIGGVYYATGSTDALDTIGSDTDTEVLNDTNDTAQRHGVCIATITACTVLLALCTTTAYWIVCKQQQPDSAYTTIGML